jgi:hypothetical protein
MLQQKTNYLVLGSEDSAKLHQKLTSGPQPESVTCNSLHQSTLFSNPFLILSSQLFVFQSHVQKGVPNNTQCISNFFTRFVTLQ